MIFQAGGILLYTPPYCFDCTPLDNGAFGWIKRYLQKNSSRLAALPLERALAKAFEAAGPSEARSWFRECGYDPWKGRKKRRRS